MGKISLIERLVGRYWSGRRWLTSHYDWRVARPIPSALNPLRFSWKNESVLILGLEDELVSFARLLSDRGASITFRSLANFQDIYQLPLEQFTVVIMNGGLVNQQFDIIDIGATLRRADDTLTLVWASSIFNASEAAGHITSGFCDVTLALPAKPEDLERVFLSRGRFG